MPAVICLRRPPRSPSALKGPPWSTPSKPCGIDLVYTVCGMCPGNCGTRCRVAQGTVVKIGGNPYNPISVETPLPFDTPLEKAITPRGGDLFHRVRWSPVSLRPLSVVRPLKRVGPRGSGKWKALTWEQAVDEIVVDGGDLFDEGRVSGLKEIKGSRQGLNLLAGRADWGAMRFLEGFVRALPGAALSRDRAARLDATAVEVARSVSDLALRLFSLTTETPGLS